MSNHDVMPTEKDPSERMREAIYEAMGHIDALKSMYFGTTPGGEHKFSNSSGAAESLFVQLESLRIQLEKTANPE